MPLVSAGLLFLSFVPVWGFPLAHLALAPVLAGIIRTPRVFSIWLFGASFAAVYFFWVKVFSPLAPILLTFLHGCWITLGLWPAVVFSRRGKPFLALASASAAWTVSEFLRGLGPYGYEWGALGYTQYGSLKLAAYSSLGGIWLVSFLVFVSNAVLTWSWRTKNQAWIAAAAVYWGLLWAGSPADRLSDNISAANDFVLVQTNISPYAQQRERETVMREQLKFLSGETARARGRYLILPETLFSTEILGARDFLTEEPRALLIGFFDPSPARRLVVGAIERDETGFYNSAILLDAQGARLSSYRKQHLVPFGETIPGLEGYEIVRKFGDKLGTPFFSEGDTSAPIWIGERRVSILICFEGTFSSLVRETARDADLLINISNDAWSESEFGHEQHLRFLRFRAIETGRPVLRVGNSGPTAVYAPSGKLIAEIPGSGPGVLDLGAVGPLMF